MTNALEFGRSLLSQISDGVDHAMHLQLPQHDDDRAACRVMTHGEPPSFSRYRIVKHWPWAHLMSVSA